MKLRWSVPCILITLLIVGASAVIVVPKTLQPLLGGGGQAPDAARLAAPAAPTPTECECKIEKSDMRTRAAEAPTATPLPTPAATPVATPTPVPVVSRAILVDQDAQLVHVYENGVEIRTIPCSTGLPTPDKLTPAWSGQVGEYVGTFFSFGTYQDEGWRLFKDFLIHGAPYTLEGGVKVYQDLGALGQRPVSHGCIRIAPEDAVWLTKWNPKGVPAAITPLTRTFDQ